MKRLNAEVIVDYENARRYIRIASKFVNQCIARIYRITKRLVFNIMPVNVPGFVTMLTSRYYNKKIYGNQLVDQEIVKYLLTEFKANVLVLIAGDNHYAEALRVLKRRGVYIIVIAHVIAHKLLKYADEYYIADLNARDVFPVKF